MLRSRVTKLALRHSTRMVVPRHTITATAVRAYNSTWDAGDQFKTRKDGSAQPWQAEGAMDIQRVTQTALIHELIQQQTSTIQSVVPWFLSNMPPPYFRQVPEKFRVDHIKAIAAIKGEKRKMYYTTYKLVSFPFEIFACQNAKSFSQ